MEKYETNVEALKRYLGLLVYMGRSRSKTFSYINDKIWKKVW